MIINICAIIVTLLFLILVIFLVRALNSTRILVNRLDYILSKNERQLEILLKDAQIVSEDIQHKLKSVDSLFQVISTLGEFVNSRLSELKQEKSYLKSRSFNSSPKGSTDTAIDFLELLGLSIYEWKNLKRRSLYGKDDE